MASFINSTFGKVLAFVSKTAFINVFGREMLGQSEKERLEILQRIDAVGRRVLPREGVKGENEQDERHEERGAAADGGHTGILLSFRLLSGILSL